MDREDLKGFIPPIVVDQVSNSCRSTLQHQHQLRRRVSCLPPASCYSLADLNLVYGCSRSALSASGNPVGQSLQPDWAPAEGFGGGSSWCHSRQRADRPESVDTDSSADSGIHSTTSTNASHPTGCGSFVTERRDLYRHPGDFEIHGKSYRTCQGLPIEQRMPIVQDGLVPKNYDMYNCPSAADRSTDTRLGPETGPSRAVDGSPRVNAYIPHQQTEYRAQGQLRGGNMQTSKGFKSTSSNSTRVNDWVPPPHSAGLCGDQRICAGHLASSGPVKVPRQSLPMDHRISGIASGRWSPSLVPEQRSRDLFRRSNSTDSGYQDRPVEVEERHLQSSGKSDRTSLCLETTHYVPLSPPVTPLHGNLKKSTTPNLLKRQLKTISEVMSPLRKPKSLQTPKTGAQDAELSPTDGTYSDSSDDDDDDDDDSEDRRNMKNDQRGKCQPPVQPSPVLPPSFLIRNSLLAEPRRRSSGGLHLESGSKKSKPRASRSSLWSKKFGELKSAPSSPELSRKNSRIQELTSLNNNNCITVKTPTSILELTNGERLALQKIAIGRLQQMGLGQINIPKSGYERRRTLKRIFQLRKNVSNGTTLTSSEGINKGGGSGGGELEKEKSSARSQRWTFGIPLETCISNDVALDRLAVNPPPDITRIESEKGENGRLIDALSLPVQRKVASEDKALQVPYIVRACCNHLKEHALRVKGLFRIGGLKTRVVQLKQEFDSGAQVEFTAEHSPHDVASLLKEFLRDLPQCLLTRDLHQPFIATAGLKTVNDRLEALRFLVALLPVTNRDTLWMLLSLLKAVANNSTDQVTKNGSKLPGNCMDSSNLATLFGPNILHKFKPGKSHADSVEQLNQHADVTAVVRQMIDSFPMLFKLPEETHREILAELMERNPEAADYILCHQGNAFSHQDPSESSDISDLRENSFLTSSSSIVSNTMLTEPSKMHDFSFAGSVQAPTKQKISSYSYMDVTDGRTTDEMNRSRCSNASQRTDGSSVCRNLMQEQFKMNNGDFDTRQAYQSPNLTSTPKLESQQNNNSSQLHCHYSGDAVNMSQLHLCPTISSEVSLLEPTKNVSQLGESKYNGLSPRVRRSSEGLTTRLAVVGSWEQQRWKYWEELAKKHSEELHEQQTLV